VTEFVRADLSVDPWTIVATPSVPLTGTGVKQNTSVTIQTIVHNPSNVQTSVNCGRLATNHSGPTRFTYAALPDDSIPSALSPVTLTTTTQTVGPNGGTAVCQYKLTAPGNLGLLSIPLVAIMTTPSGNVPQDPNPLNNLATGTFTIISNGEFTRIPDPVRNPEGIFARQDWNTTLDMSQLGIPGVGVVDGLPVGTIQNQVFQARDMALLVVPTNARLGDFKLSDTIYVNGTKIGVANIPTTTLFSGGVCITSGPASVLTNAIRPNLVFAADICAQPAANPGFSEVYVGVVQSLLSPATMTSNPVVYQGELKMRLVLEFTLPGSAIPDRVSATIRISVSDMSAGCLANIDFISMSCFTAFSPFSVTTP
jgi:hypothetical protein